MGHESRIELWSPTDRGSALLVSELTGLVANKQRKPRGEEPQSLGHSVQQPSTWCGRSEQITLYQVGCEARKRPAVGDVFFLDFPFYRTNQALARRCEGRLLAISGFPDNYPTYCPSNWASGLLPSGRQHVSNCEGGLMPPYLPSADVTRELPLFQKRRQMRSGI